MPRDDFGTYEVPNTFTNGTVADATKVSENFDDIAQALTQSVPRDGSAAMTGDFDLDNNKVINVADPTSADDAATKGYVDAARRLVKPPTLITVGGTHTYDASTTLVVVELFGAGGGGGGANPNGATTADAGSGGGSGGYVKKTFLRNAIASATIVIGARGMGVSGADGTTGGNSTYSDGVSSMTASGGVGGGKGAATAVFFSETGGSGGAAAGGDINIPGNPGQPSIAFGTTISSTATQLMAQGGTGAFAVCPVGSPSRALVGQSTGAAASGTSGNSVGYNAGGSGSWSVAATINTAPKLGGNGAPGLCIITEYA